ncbi:MAG: response regulator [Magnetococcales bacterium]|nr:response regulator [Magnetococcales bacterium]
MLFIDWIIQLSEKSYLHLSLGQTVTMFLLFIMSSLYFFKKNHQLNKSLNIADRELKIAKKTTQKALEDCQKANQAKSDFLANMSHEIRTPLNPIIGLTHLAMQDNLTVQTRGYLNKIESSSKTLLKVIDDILDFSKIEDDKIVLEKFPFSLDGSLKNIKKIYGAKAKEKGLKLQIWTAPEIPKQLNGDPVVLEQVFSCLISNAIKFTKKGHIDVVTQLAHMADKKVHLKFTIQDSGIGMTKQQCENLFTAFTQADSSTTRLYGGTGLGLSICSELISLMGGKIAVDSLPGKGSIFSFNLEFELVSTPEIYQPLDKFGLLPVYNGEKVLLAEDNKTNQLVAKELLEGVGLCVSVANNGEQAVSMSKNGAYDLILMDIQMPVMDGYKASQAIKKEMNSRDIPIIAMTAHTMASDREKCIAWGMVDHIKKPIDPDLFYQTLIHWLPSSSKKRKTKQTHKQFIATDEITLPKKLAGIDMDSGLYKVRNNKELFGKLLFEFHQDHKDDDKMLSQAIMNANIIEAQRIAHTLKGAAGNLGAKDLSKRSGQLEYALNFDSSPETEMQSFHDSLRTVMDGLAKLKMGKKETLQTQMTSVADSDTLKGLINNLTQLLKEASPQAMDIIPHLNVALGWQQQNLMNDLASNVGSFQFESALEKLQQLNREIETTG